MIHVHYTPADYKKYLYALGVQRLERLHDIGERLDPAGHQTCIHDELGDIRGWLYRAAFVDDDEVVSGVLDVPAAKTGDESLNYYSDGRPVTTTVHWDGGWATHIWHPDPLHLDNRPGQVSGDRGVFRELSSAAGDHCPWHR